MLKKEILQNQQKILDLKLVRRELYINDIIEVFKLNKILAFIGARRSGKTFLSFQFIKELVKKELVEIEDVVYIDFSGTLEKNLDLETLKEDYLSIFPDRRPFFVFDEIQELENFPEKLISLLNRSYKILITGSNGHLLSREISTILRGKVYTKEVFPLDFKEYLYFKNIGFSRHSLISNKPKYKQEFSQFLKWGGFPEIVLTDNEIAKKNILKTYLDIMIYKDLIDRYKIKNDFALSFFIKRILSTIGKKLNINKIFNELKGNNISLGKDVLYNFYEYLSDIYFIGTLNNFWSQIKGLKKTYLIDISFLNLVGSEDLGQRFENLVFLHLKKLYDEIYFLNKNYEIDFYLPSSKTYIQVVYELNYDNIERETKNLLKQNGKKMIIYFEKESNLNLNKDIEYIEFSELFIPI